MSSMYRVVRPFKYDPHRRELVTQLCGGVVFRLESDGEHRFWVTAARCDLDAYFSMNVATRICDDRAAQIRDNDPCSTNGCFSLQKWEVMRPKVIEFFEKYEPKDDTPAELYRAAEFKRIAETAKLIIEQNESEQGLLRVAEEALVTQSIAGMYAAINNLKG